MHIRQTQAPVTDPGPQRPVAPAAPRSMAAVRAAVTRARAGDPAAIALLRQVPGGGAAVATPPAAEPCVLTETTAPDVPGDVSADEALEATRTLPAAVQSGNGGRHRLTTDCRRREFLRWAREWFGTYRDAIAHFSAIEPASVPGHPQVHHDVKERLEAVAAELGAAMPSTSTAFAFRSDFRGAHPSPLSMHTLGYALDYDAYGMPQMASDDMSLLIELMTRGPANAQIRVGSQVLDYGPRRDAIRRMGDRTAAGADPTARDANATAVITGLGSEITRLTAASASFQTILGADGRAQFLELRTRYFEAAPADRPAVLAQVAPLLAPLFTAIDAANTAAGVTTARRTQLASLRAKLANPQFLFGSPRRSTAPRAPRRRPGEPEAPPAPAPRPTTAHTVSAPSLAQLFERGWFTPGTGGERWGADFALAMARHGFEGGYVWGGASQDSMHFELVVARPFRPPAAPASARARAATHGAEHGS